jgi:hypothetical protein
MIEPYILISEDEQQKPKGLQDALHHRGPKANDERQVRLQDEDELEAQYFCYYLGNECSESTWVSLQGGSANFDQTLKLKVSMYFDTTANKFVEKKVLVDVNIVPV